MKNDLLEKVRQQAELADASIRAAALLRIVRVESAADLSTARQTLLDGLDAVQKLPEPVREDLLNEARLVAAAVSAELLAVIPAAEHKKRGLLASYDSFCIVQTMLTHGHVDAAFDYLIQQNDPEPFPFRSVGDVLHRLDAARRRILLCHAVELWRQEPSGRSNLPSNEFVWFFEHHWKDFPPEEALSIARTILDRAAEEPDAGTSAGYANEVHFSSRRQNTLFQILHVLRHLDPALARSLVDSHSQLAVAAGRYPNGLETMEEEAEAEAKRRQADGATCQGGGYILTGGEAADRDRQRRLIDAARNGDFGPSIEDAIEKYREDTSPESRNYAPKEYWPSTAAFRTVLYQAGRRLGSEATMLLEQIPDGDLRLFATIELAAALAGVSAYPIMSMKRPSPPGSQRAPGKIIAARGSTGMHRGELRGPAMRAPDGRVIRCPKCLFQPPDGLRWSCKCGHLWNTFWTAGKCPACHFQWEVTACPHCGEMSEHHAWYQSES